MNDINSLAMKAQYKNIPNKPARIMKGAFSICFLLIITCFIVGNSDIDLMDYGFGIIAILLFMALMAAITGFVYIGRARAFRQLVDGMKPLAVWDYTPEFWQQFVQLDFKENKATNRGMLKVVMIIILMVGAGLVIWAQDILMVYIAGGLALLLAIVAFVAPVIRKNIVEKGPHMAIIGKNAIFMGGTFQMWGQAGISLKKVTLETEGNISWLSFLLEAITLQGLQKQEYRVPIPENKMDEAKLIIKTF
jgi:peptidoglycan/LPS O-acetylase OafA/YrhL